MNPETNTTDNLVNENTNYNNNATIDDNITPEIENNNDQNNDTQETSNTEKNNESPNKPNYELEIKELKDKYLRLHAEFDTAKRRMARERIELTQTAGREIITELLPVLDDFERAFKVADNNNNNDLKGFELIFNKLKMILEQKGLNVMKTIGTTFDPDLHEAIAQLPAPNDDMRDKILDEAEKGYYIHDKILRYAKVVVAK